MSEESGEITVEPRPSRRVAARCRSVGRHVFLFLVYGTLAILLGGGYLYVSKIESQADLSPWHSVDLEEEFKARREDEIRDLAGYLALEDRLFAELESKVYMDASTHGDLSRYRRGSPSNPNGFGRNWNRTFEIVPENPRAGLLLLHGMSDSPYSVRALGQAAGERDVHVVGLRLPGHGTAPAGMAQATWRDMAAAVRLGMRHLRSELGDGPLYIMGYSNGAALAVDYSLEAMVDDELPRVAGLVLLAPSIGVRSVAAFARWQARLARWLDVDKMAWTSVHPEVDPFKYTSFAVNAGAQVFAITRRISKRVETLAGDGPIEGFPPVLAFLSSVDATVEPAAVVSNLLGRLAPEGHELVLFDINFMAKNLALVAPHAVGRTEAIRERTDLPFDLTIISNETTGTLETEEWRRPVATRHATTRPLGIQWPEDTYALSHIATPFPPDDPVYGNTAPIDDDRVFLGRIEAMGERGVLLLSPAWQVRLRHNPFYEYVERRSVEWMGLGSAPEEIELPPDNEEGSAAP